MRAPTPTGAAEIAVPVKADLEAALGNLSARLRACMSRSIDRKRQAARAAMRALPQPDQLLAVPRRRFDEATGRLERGLSVGVERKRARLSAARLSPATLSRRIGEWHRLADRDLLRAQTALRTIAQRRRAEFRHAADRLPKGARAAVALKRSRFESLQVRATVLPLQRALQQARERLASGAQRQERAMAARLDRLRAALTQADRLLSTLKLSEQAILERGYALVIDRAGTPVRRAAEVEAGVALDLRFVDGTVHVRAGDEPPPAAPKPASRPPAKPKDGGGQGSLF